jgi:hypothetical protein
MKLLIKTADYIETIKIAKELKGEYLESVIFHCYWNGILNEKHLYSILSFYYFNVHNNKHKIILWIENNTPNEYNDKIKKYAEIKYFNLKDESAFLENRTFYYSKGLTYYSDLIRSVLLYNYGGCWFDLDCFCLRNFDPIFKNFGNEICLYQWEHQNYPNNAIYISLLPKSDKMKKNIEFIIKRNRGWGFQEANLTFDLDLDMLILPCGWFDGSWITNPYNLEFRYFFTPTNKKYNFDNFFKGAFCYHWHNNWNMKIDDSSIFKQLVNCIEKSLS